MPEIIEIAGLNATKIQERRTLLLDAGGLTRLRLGRGLVPPGYLPA